jgi:hypothetical protein
VRRRSESQTTQHLFFQGRNYFGRHGGERARPLNIYFGRDGGERVRPLYIYFFEVVIIFGETEVRGPDQSTQSKFIFLRSL